MRHLMTATGRDFFREVERLGLTFSQIKVLMLLADREPVTLGAVSDGLGLSLPAVSRAVEDLVQRGMVKRVEDRDDRRARRVSPTAKGRHTVEGLTELRLAEIRQFVRSLEPEERAALAAGLEPLMQRPEIAAPTRRR